MANERYIVNEIMQNNAKFKCVECGVRSTAEEWDEATRMIVADEVSDNIIPIVYGAGEEDGIYYCPKCGLENCGADLI